jgi:primosomal protein N' (replication factor Y)
MPGGMASTLLGLTRFIAPAPRPCRHPQRRARAARLSRARRHGGRARLVVVAPLGPRQLIGVAWEAERLPTEEVGDNRLRPLAGLLDVPPIPAPLRRLCEWTADYYLSPLASVLRMVLPSPPRSRARGSSPNIADRPRARPPDPAARPGARRLEGPPGHDPRACRACRGQRRRAARPGQRRRARARCRSRPTSPLPAPTRTSRRPPQARSSAAAAASSRSIGKRLRPRAARRRHRLGQDRSLFRSDRRSASAGPQALVLLPEIALTEPFLKRFEARFGCEPVAWHSDLRSSQRRRAWRGSPAARPRWWSAPLGAVPALRQPRPDRRRRSA